MAVLNKQIQMEENSNYNTNHDDKNGQEIRKMKDGCLILGQQNEDFLYVTKYRIKRNIRRKNTCVESLERSFMPCISTDDIDSCPEFITAFIKSEFFIVLLHLGTLTLSALKEVYDLRQLNPRLHFVTSVFEEALCILTIIIRVFGSYIEFRQASDKIGNLEYVEGKRQPFYVNTLKTSCIIFILLATLIIMLVIASFILLHMYLHLGWTIITTNSSLLLIHIVYLITKQKREIVINRAVIDRHKVVLQESLLLITEGMFYRGWVSEDYILRCRNFIAGINCTPLFTKPYYIDVDDFDNLTMCETITSL